MVLESGALELYRVMRVESFDGINGFRIRKIQGEILPLCCHVLPSAVMTQQKCARCSPMMLDLPVCSTVRNTSFLYMVPRI